jgi:hypothetical protein
MVTHANRAKMTTATTGTGTITLGSAADGYQSFADAGVSNGDTVRYVIEDGNNWEIGTGTYTASGTTLSRSVTESNNSDSAINLSGSASVFLAVASQDLSPTVTLDGAVTGSGTLTDLGDVTITTTATSDPTITLSGAVTGSGTMTNLGDVTISTTAASDPTITLSGAVTGSGTMTNLGDVTISTTATADPTLTLSGDVTGSATFTNLGNATLSTTIAANSVALGTDTTGNYVSGATGGTGVTISGSAGEGWSPTISIGQAVGTGNSPHFVNLYIEDKLFHYADSNTYLQFGTDAAYLYTGGTYVQFSPGGIIITDGSLAEDYDALSGTTPTINVTTGGMFSLTMSGNTTFTFSGSATGYSQGFILQLTGNGSTVTYPSSVDWAGGSAPDAPASGETDILVFISRDGGTTWYGALALDAAA